MIDWHDVVERTVVAAGLGAVVQAVEHRAPTTRTADQYAGALLAAAYIGGLVLVNANDEGGIGQGSFEAGEALLDGASYGVGSLLTRYVDSRLAASGANVSANLAAPVFASVGGGGSAPGGVIFDE
jgi:hypothetical protein